MKPTRNQPKQFRPNDGAPGDAASRLRLVTLLAFGIAFLAYVLLLTKNYYWDGIFFAQVIEDAPRVNATLIHPSHLLDLIFEYALYRGVRVVGFHPRALLVLQVSNCFLGAAAVALFFRICFDWFKSLYVSLVVAALFAFSAIWWRFATDSDTYIFAVLFLLAGFWLLGSERKPRPIAVAAIHAFAMLLHQLSVFFFPVAIAGLIFQTRDKPRNQRQAIVLGYTLTVIALTLGVYYLVFHLVMGTWSAAHFVKWITYFSPENGFAFSVWSNLVYSIRSQWRTLLGGRTAFVRDMWGPAIVILASLTVAAVVVFFFWLLRRWHEVRISLASVRREWRKSQSLIVLCGLWIAPYLAFLFFFIPQNTFYRLFYLPAIMLLVGVALAAIESSPHHVRRYRAALFVAVVFLANLTFSQYPYAQTRANPPLELALKLNQVWPIGTTIYLAAPNSDDSLIRYFNPGTVWVQVTPAEIAGDMEKLPPSARSAWLDTTLVDQFEGTAEGRSWLATHAIPRSDCELVNKKFRIRFYQLKPASFSGSN